MFSIATKRFSLVEKGIIIVEEELNSGWISLVTLGKDELFFIKSLAVDSKMYITFLDLYLGWEASLIALACSRHTGQFKINDFNTKARKEVLEQCFALQDEISCLRSSIKKETQINKKVEINARINALKQLYMEYIKKI